MTRSASPRVGAYAALVAFGLLASLVLGRPELVALAAPFALLLAVGLASARAPQLDVSVRLERERALEAEDVRVDVVLGSEAALPRLEVGLALPSGLDAAPGSSPVSIALRPGEERTVAIPVACARWGAYAVGDVVLRARDALGLFEFEAVARDRSPLRVYPRPETLLDVLKPLETQVFAGNQVARAKADGIEFADIRPFASGDRVRRVNWRATARLGELVVNELHPERNTDVILFVDSFAEVRRAGLGTLDLTVRAAAALAGRYLDRKDRVGVVGFGGIVNWLLPATGLVQLYRIVEALLDTEVVLNYAWKDVDVIPARTLPPQALVIGLTPLLDLRAVNALLDLRARGFDLAVVEIAPEAFVGTDGDEVERLAHRLWVHRRAALRHRFEQIGVPVTAWHEGEALAASLEEVAAYRRHVRVSRA